MGDKFNTSLSICPVFGRCGGCQHQDIPYDDELRLKDGRLRELLCSALPLSAEVFFPITPSPKSKYYRNRIDLKLLKRRDGTVHIGFSPAGRGPVVEMEDCQLAMECISNFLPRLRQEAVVKLPAKYKMANLVLRCGDGDAVRWGGIGRASTKLSSDEYLYTDINGKKIYYSLDTFFQANLSILPIVRQVMRSLPIWDKEAVFYDLYGGVGLFSLMVHDLVAKVIDIEENPQAIRLARWNMMQNHIANMEIMAGRVEACLPDSLSKAKADINIAMVDPPRAGLSPAARRLISSLPQIKHLVYLSCAPESLAVDLKGLCEGGWSVIQVRPFDFFPRTRHMETLVYLAR